MRNLLAPPRMDSKLSFGYVVEVVVKWFSCCVLKPSSVTVLRLANYDTVTLTSYVHYKT